MGVTWRPADTGGLGRIARSAPGPGRSASRATALFLRRRVRRLVRRGDAECQCESVGAAFTVTVVSDFSGRPGVPVSSVAVTL